MFLDFFLSILIVLKKVFIITSSVNNCLVSVYGQLFVFVLGGVERMSIFLRL